MCGRFTQMMTWEELHSLYSIHDKDLSNLEPRYNISPTDPAWVVLRDEDGNVTSERMRWWLVPSFWKKKIKEVPATFNARCETVTTAPMFRQSYRTKRCVVPASGFYEWTGPKADRLPWYITSTNGLPLSIAGLWERWTDPETNEAIRSFTIITTDANTFMGKIHDRMPVILDEAGIQTWLSTADEALLRPAPENTLQAWRVDKKVNSNRYQEPDAVTPIADPTGQATMAGA
jgi:putative SOS response-associated peptidase YedK